jgi:N-acetylneuraminic acid mutarotase
MRPYLGRYHAAEVVNGKLDLIGGFGGGSEGRVQIYDRAANTWATGADLPWRAGALGTAVISGKIYATGGLTTGSTASNCAQYDPAMDEWTTKASMPQGRSHAATGTDGTKLFVFGGRRGLDLVVNGFDSVMVYDSAADSWTWSGDSGSTLAPNARGPQRDGQSRLPAR